jgi:hypothetical protein
MAGARRSRKAIEIADTGGFNDMVSLRVECCMMPIKTDVLEAYFKFRNNLRLMSSSLNLFA